MKFIYSLFQRIAYRFLGFFIPFLVHVIFLIRMEGGGELLRIAILSNATISMSFINLLIAVMLGFSICLIAAITLASLTALYVHLINRSE